MGSKDGKWKRVSRQHVCPVCGKCDWCMVSADAVLCMRIESLKPTKHEGWIHPLDGNMASEWQRVPAMKATRRQSNAELDAIWRPRAELWRERGRFEVLRLAEALGVTIRSLRKLQTGFDGRAWTFPERDGDGLIVGISRRFEDGSKRCVKGSRRGLTYSADWNVLAGPVLIVEGASDVAAGITLGLPAIGRPSNRGGGAYLAKLLRGEKQKIIVIGERDRKPDGRWPGMEGCRSIAIGLSKALHRYVVARLLPGDAKDLRAWLNTAGIDASRERLLRELGEWQEDFCPGKEKR